MLSATQRCPFELVRGGVGNHGCEINDRARRGRTTRESSPRVSSLALKENDIRREECNIFVCLLERYT